MRPALIFDKMVPPPKERRENGLVESIDGVLSFLGRHSPHNMNSTRIQFDILHTKIIIQHVNNSNVQVLVIAALCEKCFQAFNQSESEQCFLHPITEL